MQDSLSLVVITNHVPRFTVEAYELSADERAQFDYLDWTAIDAGEDSATFVRYKGQLHDMGDIPAVDRRPHMSPDWLLQWDGIAHDSFFSGILVRYCDNHESVVMGRYYS